MPTLEVPAYMVLGGHEARGRAVLANGWFEMLEAPSKESIVFDGSGQRAQPGQFAELMTSVLDNTSANR